MFSTRRAGLIALPAVLLFGLSGCSLLDNSGTAEPLSGVAACALGHTWTLDTADLAAQVLAELQKNHPEVTAATIDGTQTMTWNLDSTISLATDYSITVTANTATPDQPLTVVQTHEGESSGKSYINSDVGIPRNWKDTTELDTSVTPPLAADAALPFEIPRTDWDDSVGLELTCDAGVLTTHPRGAIVTQKWTTG